MDKESARDRSLTGSIKYSIQNFYRQITKVRGMLVRMTFHIGLLWS